MFRVDLEDLEGRATFADFSLLVSYTGTLFSVNFLSSSFPPNMVLTARSFTLLFAKFTVCHDIKPVV